MKSRVLELQRQQMVDKVEIDRLRLKLAALEERVELEAEERAAAAARVLAPRGLAEETVPPVRRVEVVEVSDLEEPLDEDSPRIDAGPEFAPDAPATVEDAVAGASAAQSQSDPPGGPTLRVTTVAQSLYDQGYSLYHQGRYVDAEETFQRFLAAYDRTDLGDNARYWIGECRLAREELQSALAAFRQTVRDYPEGNKSPDALLRAGEILERLGELEGARASYSEVERRFPESAASAEAAKRLAEL